MDTSSDARRTAGTAAAKGGRLRSITMIVIFDVAAPLVAYKVLRSAGLSAVTALLLSGVFPALGVTIGAVRHRRLDAVGALVLAGIVVGTVLGLVSHSARLLLVEGSVPTAVFGVVCLGSLWARRPLMYSFALEFTGPDTAKGQEMTRLWQYDGLPARLPGHHGRVGRRLSPRSRPAGRHRLQHLDRDGPGDLQGHAVPVRGHHVRPGRSPTAAYHKKKGERMAAAAGAVTEASSPEITQAADHT